MKRNVQHSSKTLKKRKVADDEEDVTTASSTICIPLSQSKLIGEFHYIHQRRNNLREDVVYNINLPRIKSYVYDFNHITYCIRLCINAYILSIPVTFNPNILDFKDLYYGTYLLIKTGTQQRSIVKVDDVYPGLHDIVSEAGFINTLDFPCINSIKYESAHFAAEMENMRELSDPHWLKQYLKAVYGDDLTTHGNRNVIYASKFTSEAILEICQTNNFQIVIPTKFSNIAPTIRRVIGIEVARIREFISDYSSRNVSRIFWLRHLRASIILLSTDEATYKPFNICGMYKMLVRYAPLDKTILAKLFINGIQFHTDEFKNLTMNDFFSIDLSKLDTRRFNNSIPSYCTTNGYELHIAFEKTVKKKNGVNTILSYEDEIERPITSSNIIGIDPGFYNPLTCAQKLNGRFQKRKITKAEFYHNSKRSEVLKRSRVMTRRAEYLLVDGNNYSLKDKIERIDLIAAVIRRYNVFMNVYPFYDNKNYLKFKMYARMKEQKELDRVVDYVMGFSLDNPILAIGNGRNLTNFTSAPSAAPFRRFLYHFTKRKRRGFININEAYTSKLTNCCLINGKHMKNERGERQNGIIHCQKCTKTFCRDYNASLSMWRIAMVKLGFFDSPKIRRKFKGNF